MKRRTFVKSMGFSPFMMTGLSSLAHCIGKSSKLNDQVIDKFELYRYDINIPRYFSFGTWLNRQHVFMKISSGPYYGWTEVGATKNNPELDLKEWSQFLIPFKNLTINEAISRLNSLQATGSDLSWSNMEFLEIGLLDLSGRILNKPAIDILKLKERMPVPGLFCILDKDMETIRSKAKTSIDLNLSSFMKVKMFGDKEFDLKVLKTVKRIIGKEATIISDVNFGYKNLDSPNDMVPILKEFHENGLYAIEDPTEMTTQQWKEMQHKVGDLILIPDVPMRPAWEAIKKSIEGMGRIYNIHPDCMGSLPYAAQLANKIKSIGARIMVGDASLTGPACTAWQQFAIGAGAVWVEAIEKFDDSENYLKCITDSATYRDDVGHFAYKPKPGFGLELDTDMLKSICPKYLEL
ncbi:MAG: hypothetical protein MI975_25525 [Cytophagales bacterium]|nr:hypothetical protein [Cytophagales bacterium]